MKRQDTFGEVGGSGEQMMPYMQLADTNARGKILKQTGSRLKTDLMQVTL